MRFKIAALALITALFVAALPASARKKAPPMNYPRLAMAVAADLDRQLKPRLGMYSATNSRGLYWLVVTTPASLDRLGVSSSLGRLMGQELASSFTALGYNVQEIRKAADIIFNPVQGEFMLTREPRALASKRVKSTLVLVGTYTPTADGVRFNVEVVSAANNNIVAMSSRTLPYSATVGMLLGQGGGGGGGLMQPNTATVDFASMQRELIPYMNPSR